MYLALSLSMLCVVSHLCWCAVVGMLVGGENDKNIKKKVARHTATSHVPFRISDDVWGCLGRYFLSCFDL